MRITDELNVSQWELRVANAAREQRVDSVRAAPTATIPSRLDRNPRDGWIDEDDLPYDQLELLERARAAEAAQTARQEHRVERHDAPRPPAPPPAERIVAHVDVTAPDTVQPEPQVDRLA